MLMKNYEESWILMKKAMKGVWRRCQMRMFSDGDSPQGAEADISLLPYKTPQGAACLLPNHFLSAPRSSVFISKGLRCDS